MAQPDILKTAFGENAAPETINDIPETRAPTDPPQKATWSTGFPKVTMTPLVAGGVPPMGQDVNGVLKAISEHVVYQNKGGMYKWSSDAAPYAKGAVIQSDDERSAYVSLADGNNHNPNTAPAQIGVSWAAYSGTALTPDATSTVKGVVQLASTAEALAGVNDTKAVTPKTLADKIGDTVVQATGQSTTNLMSQKAVTDNLNLKADKTVTVTGVGALAGGGAINANRTIDASPATKASLAKADSALQAGDFGLGAGNDLRGVPWVSGTPSDYYGRGFVTGFIDISQLNPAPPTPAGLLYGTLEISFPYSDSSGAPSYFRRFACGGQTYTSHATDNNTWSPWVATITTGDILQSTGTSTLLPMSQKATTDALNTKANTADLGTAALANTTTSPLDATVGRVLKVGDFGIGSYTSDISYNSVGNSSGFYSFSTTGTPVAPYSSYINVGYHVEGYGFQILMKEMGASHVGNDLMVRRCGEGGWGPFVNIYHSGNFNPDTKVNTTTQVIAGTGLSGGGDLSSNKTISIANSHIPIGVGQTWQDMTASRAAGTTYTNTTGRVICVSVFSDVAINNVPAGGWAVTITVGGTIVAKMDRAQDMAMSDGSLMVIVPAGASFMATVSGGALGNQIYWRELR